MTIRNAALAALLTLLALPAFGQDDRRFYLSIGDPHAESEKGFVPQTFQLGVEATDNLRVGIVHYADHGWGSWTYTTDGDPVEAPPQYFGLAATYRTPWRFQDVGTFGSAEVRREIDTADEDVSFAVAAGAGLSVNLRDTLSVNFVLHYVRHDAENYVEPRFLFTITF